MKAPLIILLVGAAVAAPMLLASWAMPDRSPKTDPPLPGKLANSVYSFSDPAGHPEWAVLRDGRKDTTPYSFGHARHNGVDKTTIREALKLIKEGKSPAGRDTGRLTHIEVRGKTAEGEELLAMSCTYCHESDDAGRYMKPIDFETHCVDCHIDQVGIVGASGNKLDVKTAPLTGTTAAKMVNPERLPHGSSDDLALVIDRKLAQWIASSPPQFKPKPVIEPGAADAPKPDEGGGRRRRGAAADAPAEAKPAEPAADAPKTEESGGGRRRGGAASAPAALAASATFPEVADVAELQVKLKELGTAALSASKNNCAYCHVNIQDGPSDKPERFVVSTQKIPVVWLTKSFFSHSAHAMVSCIDCHQQATTSNDTSAIMLPSIASCRMCHADAATPSGSEAPHDCVLCHTYHERLPASAQGGRTIEAVRTGGRVLKPAAAEAPKPTAEPAKPAEPASDKK